MRVSVRVCGHGRRPHVHVQMWACVVTHEKGGHAHMRVRVREIVCVCVCVCARIRRHATFSSELGVLDTKSPLERTWNCVRNTVCNAHRCTRAAGSVAPPSGHTSCSSTWYMVHGAVLRYSTRAASSSGVIVLGTSSSSASLAFTNGSTWLGDTAAGKACHVSRVALRRL